MKFLSFTVVVCFLACYCIDGIQSSDCQNGTNVDVDQYCAAINWSSELDWLLLKVITDQQNGNCIVSPFSLKLALLVLYEGSSGVTEKQFEDVFNFYSSKNETRKELSALLSSIKESSGDHVLNIGTRLFIESTFNVEQKYSSNIKNYYHTDVLHTNFSNPVEASGKINSWVQQLTNGSIEELAKADDLSSSILLYVANVLYYKGTWLTEFKTDEVHTGGFYINPTSKIDVEYMSQTNRFYYADLHDFDAKILRLPYKGNEFSLFIVLPNSKGGLNELIKNIGLSDLHHALFSLISKRTVNVYIPKFKFDFTTSYSKILQDLGLHNLFSNNASLPGIIKGEGTGSRPLYVTEIKQKAGIEINEKGSVAYAATEIQLENKFGMPDSVFNASHPFLFFIEHQASGTILFSGKVTNPLQMEVAPRFNYSKNPDENTPFLTTRRPESFSPPTEAFSLTNGQFPGLNYSTYDPEYAEAFNYIDSDLIQLFDDNSNWILSPASIKLTLALLHKGAGGETANEILRRLHLRKIEYGDNLEIAKLIMDLTKTGPTTVKFANFLFVSQHYKLERKYQHEVQKIFHAKVKNMDFSNGYDTAQKINELIALDTKNSINRVIEPEHVKADTTMIALNALYFKGNWKFEFDKNITIGKFYTKNETINTRMMHSKHTYKYKYLDNLYSHAISIPYTGDEYEMLILFPVSESNTQSLKRAFVHDSFSGIVSRLEDTDVSLQMPLFEIDETIHLKGVLQMLDINEIFKSTSNLSGIVENERLKVDSIVHKAKIEVNQIGTVAVATTSVQVVPLMSQSLVQLTVNKPFLFFIYSKESKNILFEGLLNLPAVVQNYQEPPVEKITSRPKPVFHNYGPRPDALPTSVASRPEFVQNNNAPRSYFGQI